MLETIDPELLSAKVAVLATLSPAGAPQLTAVWFAVEDDHVIVSVNGKRQKVRNLTGDGRCSILVYHPSTNDYFVEIRGTATLIPDDDYVIADRIGARYDADFRTFDQPGDHRFIVDLTPRRVLVTDVRH